MNKILLADANPLMLGKQKSFLEIRDFEVITTTSAKEVVDLAARHLPQLVLLDFEMHEMRGSEVCRRLKQSPATKRIPVVISTSQAPEAIQRECIEAGATSVLRKSDGRDLLFRAIADALGLSHHPHKRTTCDLRIGIDDSGERAEGMAQNISQSGLFLTLRKVMQGGAAVRLTFQPPGEATPVRILGEVIRIESLVGGVYGYGIQFLEADEESLEALKRFTERAGPA